MRCETCHRPWMTKEQHESVFSWLILPIIITAIFFAGALVESICTFNVIQTAMWVGGYMIITGIVTLWWQIKVRD
jgi:hypothetical protein